MKQVNLELLLSRIEDIPGRNPAMEQYSTPAGLAAAMLYNALGEGDIRGKVIADFGTGNGILAIGASLLGAKKVYGIEKDNDRIKVARKNARAYNAEIEFLEEDITDFGIQVDTVIMNPPFGSQVRNADRPFIEKALELSKNFYILLNSKSGDFLRKAIGDRGRILWEVENTFPLPHLYDFHRKERKMIEIRMTKVNVWKIS